MSDSQPIEQKTIDFYGDEIVAVKMSDNQIYVGLRHVCNTLGIDTQGQRQRIDRHAVLSDGRRVCKLHTHSRGLQNTHVLRVDLFPLWLSGIRSKSVNEDIRPKLERFQKEAARVLWDAFRDGRLTTDSITFSDLLEDESNPSVQAYKIAIAVARMAQQQIILESRMDNHEERIETIEAQLSNPDRYITQSQASQISQAVKAIALELGKASGKNEYGGVYGELYRRFDITSYKHLPIGRFDEAIQFLTDWHGRVSVQKQLPF